MNENIRTDEKGKRYAWVDTSVSQTTVKQRKHGHYYKDVSNLDFIDIYAVLKLFNVTDRD